MSRRVACALALLLCLTAAGCRNSGRPDRASAAPRAGVAHVVVAWLKQPGDAEARRKVIEGWHQLRQIPGVVDVYAGAVIPSDRPVVDSSYDVALVMLLEDEAALKSYVDHPVHRRVVQEVIGPNVERYRVYDFTITR